MPSPATSSEASSASAQIKLDAPSTEKDFWVCWILRETFSLPKTGPHLTFKGGTSLQSRLPSHIEWRLENDPNDPDQQSLLFTYPSVFARGACLNPQVRLEFGARSDTEPSARPMIQSYLAHALPGEFKNPSFPVHTGAPERTFWEKAMLLHEENFSNEPKPNVRMARHYYDVRCLLNAGIGDKAVAAPGLFDNVANHRAIFFRKKKEARDSLQRGSLAIQPRDDRRAAWQQDYEAMKSAMFFAPTPEFADM